MIYISHRGNIKGKNPDTENSVPYIKEALRKGFDVEVDVWRVDDEWFLGHDDPQYKTNIDFLCDERLWCHAKNIEALHEMMKSDIHCFWHQEDDVTLTSRGYLWTYPGKELTESSICVLPESVNHTSIACAGICSDYIDEYRQRNPGGSTFPVRVVGEGSNESAVISGGKKR